MTNRPTAGEPLMTSGTNLVRIGRRVSCVKFGPAILRGLLVATLLTSLVGCPSSGRTISGAKKQKADAESKDDSARPTTTEAAAGTSIDPKSIKLMTEVDGIPIPRIAPKAEVAKSGAKIPVDFGNEHAAKKPAGGPVTGDTVTIRFNAEPKSLNFITENSAYKTYIMADNVVEGLYRQDGETYEYIPHLAKTHVAEDSVKLAPSYPGKVRRIAIVGKAGEPADSVTFDYQPSGDEKNPSSVTLLVTDADGKPVPSAWVGLFPGEGNAGAPSGGYHDWTNAEGQLKVAPSIAGNYIAKTGVEIYGKAVRQADGGLWVTAATAENPLHEMLKSLPEPVLKLAAGEWVDLQEQTHLTFTLRDDATWSDGAPFTSRDLLLGYLTIRNNTVDADPVRGYMVDLIDCVAHSPQSLTLKNRQQFYMAFEVAASLGYYALPYHQFAEKFKQSGKELTLEKLTPEQEAATNRISVWGQEYGQRFNKDPQHNRKPLGTGPYVITDWLESNQVVLERNPKYWNPGRGGYIDKLVFKFIIDDVTAMQALRAGQIDFFYRMNPDQFFVELKGSPAWFSEKYVKASWYTPSFGYFGWNLLRPEFQDRRVRVALSLLFDKQEFLERSLYNAAEIVSGSAYVFGPAYDHSVTPLKYSPETATRLLNEAGYVDTDNDGILDKNGKPLAFTIILPPGNKVAQQRVELYQRNLKDVGVSLQVHLLEWATFIDRIKRKDFEICTLSWASTAEADPYALWHSSGAGADKRGSNHVSFANKQADELIDKLRVTLDPKQRHPLQHALHRILDAEQPYMFLYCNKDLGAYHQRIRGVKWYRVRPGFDLCEWWVPKDEQLHP